MRTRTNQSGMTFWGLLVIAAIFAFFVMLFFKLLPPYMENASVMSALEGLAKQPEAGNLEKAQIKEALERRFNIEYVTDLDLKKVLFVEKKPGSTAIRIAYERRIPLAYNVSAVVEFDHTVTVKASTH